MSPKTHNYKQQRHSSTQIVLSFESSGFDDELNQLATELDDLSRRYLRDGALQEILFGHESEIRQDAILLALEWHLKGSQDHAAEGIPSPLPSWHLARVLRAALKITKLRYLRRLSKEVRRSSEYNESCGPTSLHPVELQPHERPGAAVKQMLRNAICQAVKFGRISPANASIAMLVYVDCEPVSLLAKRFRVHRSAIHQRLHRVRQELVGILDHIELRFL